MTSIEIKQKINQTLDNLTDEELTLVDNLLSQITAYLKSKNSLDNSLKNNLVETDPLAQLRNSDFIGCFSGEPDLAEKSEEIIKTILSNKNIN
jgi:hypothetical protein